MKQVTQSYKRSFSGSVGAGLGSVFGSSGKQFYMLEHKISSKYHQAGESQEIIVDQIEIGRDPRCQVRFDESFTTVSRRHAAIVKEGDKWKLVQLSDTNPTLLNGNKVGQEWYLQNGDEIQLAIGGPKLGFLIPAGKTTGSIGFTRRLDLFGKQALRPYRRAILLLSLFLLLAIAGGSYIIWNQGAIISDTQTALEDTKTKIDSLTTNNANLKEILETQMKARQADSIQIANMPRIVPAPAIDQLIAAAKKDIYFVITTSFIEYENRVDTLNESYGTGFVTQDGYFVTARHCVEPWLFNFSEESNCKANALATSYPDYFKVYSEVKVFSKNGLQLKLKSARFTINRQYDIVKQIDVDEDNHPVKLRFAAPVPYEGQRMGSNAMYAQDWAYTKVNQQSSLLVDYDASVALRAGEDIHILGFPQGHGVADGQLLIEPIYNRMSIARDGLDNEGCILTSQGADHGNSGGPVFAVRGNKLVVVGIVSRLDRSDQYNHIVPIKQIKN